MIPANRAERTVRMALTASQALKEGQAPGRYLEWMRPYSIALTLLCFLALCLGPLGAEPLYHVVAAGETVYGLARTFSVPAEAILSANGIKDPSKIKAGQKLLIPTVHKVAKGETLYGIARQYAISVEDLLEANQLSSKSVIVPGQLLVLPASAKVASTAASPSGKPAGTATGSQGAAGSGAPATGSGKAAVASSSGSKTPSGTGSSSGSPAAPMPPLVKTSSKAVDSSLAWPCKGEARYLDGKIDGIMILTEKGMASKAIASGRVVSAGPYRGFGLVVMIETAAHMIYVYGGNDSLSVRAGDMVKTGQKVGTVGYDAKEGRDVAYFFVFKDGTSFDRAKAPRG